ncbi:hypothetical protein GGR58DRAFT_83525 [Xylaria digitata]|nr:hypothetical protein GGR58DRAFT_83525 [Xylaria digitata]
MLGDHALSGPVKTLGGAGIRRANGEAMSTRAGKEERMQLVHQHRLDRLLEYFQGGCSRENISSRALKTSHPPFRYFRHASQQISKPARAEEINGSQPSHRIRRAGSAKHCWLHGRGAPVLSCPRDGDLCRSSFLRRTRKCSPITLLLPKETRLSLSFQLATIVLRFVTTTISEAVERTVLSHTQKQGSSIICPVRVCPI